MLLLLICCIVLVTFTFDVRNLEGVFLWVKENKLQGSLLFLAIYTVALVLMVPAMVMSMCSGAIFGLLAGTVIVWLGSAVGQVMAFIVGRYLLRDFVLRYLTNNFPKWGAIDRALEREGWKLVTMLRLSPIVPWNILNYALAVTSVPVWPYALASSLAVIPYLVMFVYFGSLARTLSDIFSGLAGPDTRTTILLGTVSGVLLVAIVWWTTQFARQAIRDALQEDTDEAVADAATSEMDVLSLLRGVQAADSAGESQDVAVYSSGGMACGPHRGSTHLNGGSSWGDSNGVAAHVTVVGGAERSPLAGDSRALRNGDHPIQVQLVPLLPGKQALLSPRGEARSSDLKRGVDNLSQVTWGGSVASSLKQSPGR